MRAIFFYSTNKPFGEFSNFWWAAIDLDGRRWPTSEHYFQAAKFFRTDPAWSDMIRQAQTPMIAAQCGRSRAHPIDPDWEAMKDDVMRLALLAKFTQHPDLQSVLLSTGDQELVEHTRNDRYWGDGASGTRRGSGRNMLGVLLMELRDMIRNDRVAAHDAEVRARRATTAGLN